MFLINSSRTNCLCGFFVSFSLAHRVVSLLEMLEFAAADFVEVAHNLGLILGERQKPIAEQKAAPLDTLAKVIPACSNLGLKVTSEQIGSLLVEITKASPAGTVKVNPGGQFQIRGARLSLSRYVYYAEAIYSTMRAELGTRTFKAISVEKLLFCDPKWLTDGILYDKYPDTVDEFQKAGRCFAYGENTACIFHLMRVTDFYLRKVAGSLDLSYDGRNWHGMADKITKTMEQKHHTKSDEWKQAEPFYAEVLTDIQAISRAHRNPVLHELEKTYDEREARNLLTVIEGFANHVASNLS
jgi:hypothetical protein